MTDSSGFIWSWFQSNWHTSALFSVTHSRLASSASSFADLGCLFNGVLWTSWKIYEFFQEHDHWIVYLLLKLTKEVSRVPSKQPFHLLTIRAQYLGRGGDFTSPDKSLPWISVSRHNQKLSGTLADSPGWNVLLPKTKTFKPSKSRKQKEISINRVSDYTSSNVEYNSMMDTLLYSTHSVSYTTLPLTGASMWRLFLKPLYLEIWPSHLSASTPWSTRQAIYD